MVHRRAYFLLVLLFVFVGIAMAKFGDDKKAQKDGSLMNEMFLEDALTVFEDVEKRARCANRKSDRWCRRHEMFFYSCKHRRMKKNCQATCRKCG